MAKYLRISTIILLPTKINAFRNLGSQSHDGTDNLNSPSDQSGCHFFSAVGSSPDYVQQDNGFDDTVTCSFLDGGWNCTTPNKGNQGLQSNASGDACLDDTPPDGGQLCADIAKMWTEECEDETSMLLSDGFQCGCMSDIVQFNNLCRRSCGMCSPVFVSKDGVRSGNPYDLDQETELAKGRSMYQKPLPRVPCDTYDVAAVANAVRAQNRTLAPETTLRLAFHDAGDFDKWAAIGGADGRIHNNPEAFYGQSRSVNEGNICTSKLLAKFKKTSLSPADAIQICAMVAVEIAGGPKFEEFQFQPGRVAAAGITQDGLLPPPFGDEATLRDYFYRMGLDDTDIVALNGGHTLGGGQGENGSGYIGDFTEDPTTFSNDYFQQLVMYENVTDNGCDYFAVSPADRETDGCHPTGDENVLLQLPSDRALMRDASLRDLVIKFAEDEAVFFAQFVKSFTKMSELGKDVSVQWCEYGANGSTGTTVDNSTRSKRSKRQRSNGHRRALQPAKLNDKE